MDEVEKSTDERYQCSQSKRLAVIDKWDDKTRLSVAATAKRRRVDHSQQSTVKQVEHVSVVERSLWALKRERGLCEHWKEREREVFVK